MVTGEPRSPDPLAWDPKADDFMNDPWPWYETLRRQAPVFHDPRHDIFFVTSYALVDEVFRDHERFSSQVDRASMRRGGLPPKVLELRSQGWPLALTMSNNDAPSHDRFKALVAPFFTPKNLEAIEAFVREKSAALIEALPRGEPVDVVTALAVPLPIAVIGRYLGLYDYGEARLKAWSDAFADEIGMLTSDERAVEIAELTLACHRAMMSTCEARRGDPQDDIISHLVASRIDEGGGEPRPLEPGELLSMLTQMLVAGNETTTNTLSGGIRRLAESPELVERLRDAPELLPRFVEELLRLESPVQGQFRRATRATELGGVPIPEGALLHVRLASANRDEAVFGADSQAIELAAGSRPPHRAFGKGMHFCLGAMLSRLELRVAFEGLLGAVDAVTLAEPAESLEYHTHFHLRGLERLPVLFR